MSESFALLFSSLLDSSVWIGQPHHVPRVWLTLVLLKGEDGVVSNTIPGLARRAHVTIAELEEALAILSAPDPYSRSPEHEGRRIEVVRGGWLVLNHKMYRSRQLLEQERDRKREDARRRRDTPLPPATDRYEPLQTATGEEAAATDRYLSVSASASASASLRSGSESEGVQGEPTPANDSGPEATEARPPSRPKPFDAPSRQTTYTDLRGYEPSDADYAAAAIAGLPREAFERRLKKARNTPIGGPKGVFDRGEHVRDVLIPQWKTWEETDRAAPARASPRRGGSAQRDEGVDAFSFHKERA